MHELINARDTGLVKPRRDIDQDHRREHTALDLPRTQHGRHAAQGCTDHRRWSIETAGQAGHIQGEVHHLVESITRPVTLAVSAMIISHRVPPSLGKRLGGTIPGVTGLPTAVGQDDRRIRWVPPGLCHEGQAIFTVKFKACGFHCAIRFPV